jgi:hypothetical protein
MGITKHRDTANELMRAWGTQDDKVAYLEIDYSNACNAACGMCNSISSSRIAKLLRQERANAQIIVPKVRQDEFFKSIEDIDLGNLRLIKFRGGEPFYIDFHLRLLEIIPDPGKVTLMYQTNGSIYPSDDWWMLIDRFQHIDISFSIDAVGKRFDYIRAGLDWNMVEDNVRRICSNAKIKPLLECTINPLNAFYYDEMFGFVKDLRKINKQTRLGWHQCIGDWDLSNTTEEVRQLCSGKFGRDRLFNASMNRLVFDKDRYNRFLNSLQRHEKRFQFDGSTVFPEIWDLAVKKD